MVVKANSYARALGYSPFVVYQGRWNTADRDIEREVVPMCKAEGMTITVWRAMGSGKFKNVEQRNEGGGRADVDDRSGSNSKSEIFERVFEYWEKVGQRKGVSGIGIALRYVMLKVSHVVKSFPCASNYTTGPLRFPRLWRTKDRAFEKQYRSSQYQFI